MAYNPSKPRMEVNDYFKLLPIFHSRLVRDLAMVSHTEDPQNLF